VVAHQYHQGFHLVAVVAVAEQLVAVVERVVERVVAEPPLSPIMMFHLVGM
jgi:Ca2+/H+ antiporter